MDSTLRCQLSCQLSQYMKEVGKLICTAKFPWVVHWQHTPLTTDLPIEVVGCPLFQYMEQVGSLICMAKFPWATNSAAHFFIFGSSGLPTELSTVSIYRSSGQPNFHAKIPMGSQRAAQPVASIQPMCSEVGISPVFPYWHVGLNVLPSIIFYIVDGQRTVNYRVHAIAAVKPVSGYLYSNINCN